MNGKKHDTRTDLRDPHDAPELTEAFIERADEYVGEKLVRRGRPKAESTKIALTVRYDPEVVEAFKATGKGWQTRMNEFLRAGIAGVKGSTSGATYKYVVYKDTKQRWRWDLLSDTGKTLANSGESFVSFEECAASIRLVASNADAPVDLLASSR